MTYTFETLVLPGKYCCLLLYVFEVEKTSNEKLNLKS